MRQQLGVKDSAIEFSDLEIDMFLLILWECWRRPDVMPLCHVPRVPVFCLILGAALC